MSGLAISPRSTQFPRLGILNDYVRIPYANGSSFASQFLYREFRARGAEVTVVGPKDPVATPADLPPKHVCFSSVPLRNHPGVHLALPNREGLTRLAEANLSMVVGQTGSALLDAGLWLRRNHGVPMVCVNTIHLPSVYDVILPNSLHQNRVADYLFQKRVIPWAERRSAEMYNDSDGLIVLSQGMKDYWQARGVTVPISVIPRSVEPKVFDVEPRSDPFPAWASTGGRLLVVCRHTREKNVLRLLDIFAQHILPQTPEASLTLVGDGPDHDLFKKRAESLGIASRCFFPGEVCLQDIPTWYRHADAFVYTSLSETYGQVISEALWCGLPVVAFHDDKGVSDQVQHGQDGFLVRPESSGADAEFASRVAELLASSATSRSFANYAQSNARRRSDPERCVDAYENAFLAARSHCERERSRSSVLSRKIPVMRWSALHTLLAGLGCLRAPATVNRHGRKQPVWDELEIPSMPEVAPEPARKPCRSGASVASAA